MLPVNGRRRREDERKTIGRKKTLGDLPCTDATLGVAKNVPAPSALPRGPGGGKAPGLAAPAWSRPPLTPPFSQTGGWKRAGIFIGIGSQCSSELPLPQHVCGLPRRRIPAYPRQ